MKCKFHPTIAAPNYCHACDAFFCAPCSDESLSQHRNRQQPEQYRCFVCQSPMSEASIDGNIEPFWNKLSQIYKYPLDFDAVVTLLVLTVLSAIFNSSTIVWLITSMAMTIYGFACLHQTANGDFDAPGVDACFSGSAAPLIYVAISHIAAYLFLILIYDFLGTGFTILFGLFFVCAYPALLIIIAIEESLFSALDPTKLIGVMKATGQAYFVMLMFILIMYSSSLVLSSFLIGDEPSFMTFFGITLVSNYYTVVVFHIMGYLVYQHRNSLGYSTNLAREQIPIRTQDKLKKTELEVLIKSGEFDDAAKIARQNITHESASLWQWSMAFELTCIGSDKKYVTDTFHNYILKLKDLNEIEKISDSYLFLKSHHPTFSSNRADIILIISNALFEAAKYTRVFKLIQESNQAFINDDDKKRALELLQTSRQHIQAKSK